MGDGLALDVFLVGQGRVCSISDASHCTCINTTGQVEKSIGKLREKGIWLSGRHSALMAPGMCPARRVQGPGGDGCGQYSRLASSCCVESATDCSLN